MNIDELKQLWKENNEQTLNIRRFEEADIQNLLSNRSSSALGKINRNILIEMGIVALFGILWGAGLLLGPGPMGKWEMGFLVFVVMGSAVFYRYKYLALNKVAIQQGNLKDSLSRLVKVMGRFMRIYAVWIVTLIPLFSVAGLFAGFMKGLAESGKMLGDVSMKAWGILAVVTLVFVGGSILFARWYVKKLYGVHYEELKKCLSELEESE